jgi:orotate phosphoribosyltransferase
MTDLGLTEMLSASGARQEGHFVLSSGLHSPDYVQCARLLEHPARAAKVGASLAEELAEFKAESVLSPAMGGLIIGYEVARTLGLPFRFSERKQGVMSLRRGFCLGRDERVLVVEDVVTTGKSALEAIEVAESMGAEVVALGAILNRSGDAGIDWHGPLRALERLDLRTYDPGACPLCGAGVELYDPGSRRTG